MSLINLIEYNVFGEQPIVNLFTNQKENRMRHTLSAYWWRLVHMWGSNKQTMMIKNELNVNYVGNDFIKKSVTNSTFEIYCLWFLMVTNEPLRFILAFDCVMKWVSLYWYEEELVQNPRTACKLDVKRWRKKLQLIWLQNCYVCGWKIPLGFENQFVV